MIEPLREPTGIGALANFLRAVVRNVRSQELMPGPGYRVNKTSQGTTLSIEALGGGSSSRAMVVKSRNGDYLVCRSYSNGSIGTTDINVAVPFDARSLASETLDGVAFSYSYSGAATLLNRTRAASYSGATETQQVTPLWKVDGLIRVVPIDYSGVSVDGADLKLIEDSSRCWARL